MTSGERRTSRGRRCVGHTRLRRRDRSSRFVVDILCVKTSPSERKKSPSDILGAGHTWQGKGDSVDGKHRGSNVSRGQHGRWPGSAAASAVSSASPEVSRPVQCQAGSASARDCDRIDAPSPRGSGYWRMARSCAPRLVYRGSACGVGAERVARRSLDRRGYAVRPRIHWRVERRRALGVDRPDLQRYLRRRR